MVVTLPTLQIGDVCILLGHNNDTGAYNKTNTDRFLSDYLTAQRRLREQENEGAVPPRIVFLGDNAYRSGSAVISSNNPSAALWRRDQHSARSIVERAFGRIGQVYGYLNNRSRLNPERHALCLMGCFQMGTYDLEQNPVRVD